MPKAFTGSFANSLDRVSELEIKEAEDGDMVESGKALLAPGDAHMILKTNGSSYQAQLDTGELVNRHRPAVDVLFRSVASIAGSAAVGVILTGMGNDGAKGMTEMHDQGALTLAQDQEACVVYGMPKVAVESGAVDESLTPEQIVKRLIEWSWESSGFSALFEIILFFKILDVDFFLLAKQRRIFLRSHFNLLITWLSNLWLILTYFEHVH